MFKKYLFLALIFIFIPLCVYAERPILERKPELIKYDYKHNLTTLQQDLYPAIYKKLSTIKINPYTKEKGDDLLEQIYDILNNYHDKHKLRFVENPKVSLYAEEINDKETICYLSISLFLLEAYPKFKITGIFSVSKFFYVGKIKLESRKENTIPEKELGSAI